MIAFDLDGTLVRDQSSWTKIHRHFGVQEPATKTLQLYENHIIDYEEFMRRDIALWPRQLQVIDIDHVLSDFALDPQAPNVILDIRKMGYEVAVISAGLDLLANKIARILGVTLVVANGLQTDARGNLTGEGIFRVDLFRKDVVLEKLLRRIGSRLDECMSVGDSKYDKTFLQRAGFGVAVGNDPELARVATFVIYGLSELVACIRSIESETHESG